MRRFFVLCVGLSACAESPRVDEAGQAVSRDTTLQLEAGGLFQYSLAPLQGDQDSEPGLAIAMTCEHIGVADPLRTAVPGSNEYAAVIFRLPRAAADAIANGANQHVAITLNQSGFFTHDHSSFWVGIDGFGTSDVVQDGDSYPQFVVAGANVTFHCDACN